MFTCHFDYEEHLVQEATQEAIESMVAPSSQDAAEMARLEADKVKW